MPNERVHSTGQSIRLGRGLAALLGDQSDVIPNTEEIRGVRRLPIEILRPNPSNPRKAFNETELDELASSIRERGVIQPILVRAVLGLADCYEIIAGERRWRAAQRANIHEVPAIVLEVGDREALEIAVIENVQRSDLNPLEEAAGYAKLVTDHGYSHAILARIVGKSRSHIANTIRLVQLPAYSRSLLADGVISAGHARALLAVPDPDILADRVVREALTVRDVERIGRNGSEIGRKKNVQPVDANADTIHLEQTLALSLGAKVGIRYLAKSAEIRITFNSIDQFNEFCDRLTTASL